MTTLRFSLYGAGLENENRNPFDAMRALGIKWTGHQAFMIADSIHFYGCTNVPDDLPIFVDRLGDGEPPGKRDE